MQADRERREGISTRRLLYRAGAGHRWWQVGHHGLHRDNIVYERKHMDRPDLATPRAPSQTLVTGEATWRAFRKAVGGGRQDLHIWWARKFYGEYSHKTDPPGADVPNPVSHVAYGYATQMCSLDRETGRSRRWWPPTMWVRAVKPPQL